MKKLLSLIVLLLCAVVGANSAWADDALTVTYSYDKINSTGNGTASVANTISVMSASLVGNYQSFNGTGSAATYNSVSVPAYSRISVSNDGTTSTSDYVRLTITPVDGCTFTPTSVSLGAIREGTDGGTMYVYANNTELNEATLSKSPVAPGRNKTGTTAGDITKYTKDGYSFSYNISDISATAENPLNIKICMSGLKNKSWGIWNVVITGTYVKEDVTTYDLTTTADPVAGGSISRDPSQAAYRAGKSVTLTAIPNYGYEFVNWTKGGVEQGTATALNITTAATAEEYVAHFNALTTYSLTVSANNGTYGTVEKSPNHDAYVAGDEITLIATPNTGYGFVNWTKGGVEVSTNASYGITTTAAATEYVANFVPLYSITYNVDSENRGTSSTGFSTEYANTVNKWTAPVNYYCAKEGYTLTKWNDGVNDYIPGTEYTLTGNITITPVFEDKGSTKDRTAEITVEWPFAKNDAAPTLSSEGNTQYYVQRATIAGNSVDIPIFVNTENDYGISGKRGKFNNTGNNAYVQVNAGTVFKIPAVKGMTVKYTTNQTSAVTNVGFTDNTSNLGGDGTGLTNATGITSDKKTVTYTYEGTGDYLYLVDINGGKYPEKLTVIYPGVYNHSTDNTTVELTKSNINAQDYLSVSTDTWNNGKNYSSEKYGSFSGDFYNMSSTDRSITIRVTGASLFEVLVQNTNVGRTYTVKVGNADAETITHGGGGIETSGVFVIPNPSEETAIVIAGGGSSVYPVAFRFNPTESATITAAGYATFCSSYPLDFSTSGLTAYIATVSGDDVSFSEVTSVPANTGVLLKGTAGEKTINTIASSATDVSANVMKGVLVNTPLAAEAGFVLMGSGEAGVAFYKNSNAFTVGAHTAYIPAAVVAARSFIDFDEATAIKAVESVKAENAAFNLRGQRVKNLTKGLYIVNGQKVVK